MAGAKRPIIYTGGGVINSGPEASQLLRELVELTGFPITSTLMGLGAYPASASNWLGMLGMHGTYEANMAMHDCDVMICIGARFDDRITGRLDAFSPNSKKIHIDIDPSSINKNVRSISASSAMSATCWRTWCVCGGLRRKPIAALPTGGADRQVAGAQLAGLSANKDVIMPQYAIQRLYELTKDRETYITTEVGQHQMWAAQFYGFEEPNRWMTSGGLGTMGYGLPAASACRSPIATRWSSTLPAMPRSRCASRKCRRAVQYELPVKIFILNNQYMGMVRQWQQLLHGNRLSHSYTEACRISSSWPKPMAASASAATSPTTWTARSADDRHAAPVIFDCRGGSARQLLPDDPLGQGAQRDAAARRGHRRSRRQRH
jgi:acetolactate synthase-1/2/3 large subunit